MPAELDFGTWQSPIKAEHLARAQIGLSSPHLDRGCVYWLESRATENGRNVLMRLDGGRLEEVVPAGFNVRSRVHEYGGGAYAVKEGVVLAVNFADQRVYELPTGGSPRPLTPESGGALRYADFAIDHERRRIYAVREDHRRPGEPQNALVLLRPDRGDDEGAIIADGHDFFSSPRLCSTSRRLAWLSWDHPDMPWDSTTLWHAEIGDDGALGKRRKIAGGQGEAIVQPMWSPSGDLLFVSDRHGWWNLFRWNGDSSTPVVSREAEFAGPAWAFGQAWHGFLNESTMLSAYIEGGTGRLGRISLFSGSIEPIDVPYSEISGLAVEGGRAVFRAGSPDRPAAILSLDPQSGAVSILRRSGDLPAPAELISLPRPIIFETNDRVFGHAMFYPPRNPLIAAPANRKPPLIIKSHGGPTGRAGSELNLVTQFYTSRGFAVCDVDYGGSTGYGRSYRERLNGRWGEVDVDDCVAAAQHLVMKGEVDPARLVITGNSAGGYTTLAALAFRDVFKAGSSLYGVSDLEALVKETHKFESRYLDRLIGAYPDEIELYRARSPIRHVDRLSCPIIFFQGLEDAIVPPNQAQMMADALRAKGVPVAHLTFAGEQHGFRKAETIQMVRRAELTFYGKVFGFVPADGLDGLVIDNLA